MLARFFHNLPWPLSLWVPSYMEDGQGNLHRAYNTTPPQRYVGALLDHIARTPPHHFTLQSNTSLPTLTQFPSPIPAFNKINKEVKRIAPWESSTDQGIYKGQIQCSTPLQNTLDMSELTFAVRISTHEKITTIQIQLIPGHANLDQQ
jgi:hypothetical protein